MGFRPAAQNEPIIAKRAALYLRVSTGRQAVGDTPCRLNAT